MYRLIPAVPTRERGPCIDSDVAHSADEPEQPAAEPAAAASGPPAESAAPASEPPAESATAASGPPGAGAVAAGGPGPEPEPRRRRGRPLWPWLVLLVAAVLGVAVGALLGLRNNSLLPGQPAAPLARPTIVVSTPASPVAVPAISSPSPLASPVVAQPSQPEQTYVVQPGDSMRSIAQQVYGDASLWPRIYDANRDVIGPDPDALQPGMRLRIPPT
jgi:nucleoid-associated protein YgaU